jgi:DNA polymerase III sliding clamp (beta) subunit (PCNA family)
MTTAYAVELETVETVPATLPAVELRNALSACLLAADKDKFALPVLHAVHVEKLGSELTFSATDRYRMVRVTVKLTDAPAGDHDSWATLIGVPDVKRIVTVLPKSSNRYGDPEPASIVPGALMISGVGSLTFEPVEGEFPKVDNVIPTETNATETFGFRPSQLADLAKMPGFGKNDGVHFTFNGAGKPARATWGTDEVSYVYVVMPVRLPE